MFDYYRGRMKVIENVFGTDWLANKGRAISKTSHPVLKLYSSVKEGLIAPDGTHLNFEFVRKLAELEDLANLLDVIYPVIGFVDIVLRVMKDQKRASEFDRFVFEARAAALHAKRGQKVEFIPTSKERGVKKPDFGVEIDGLTIPIDAMRRDRISPLKIPEERVRSVVMRLSRILDSVNRNFDVVINIEGIPSDDKLDGVFAYVAEFIEAGGSGRNHFSDEGVWCIVRDRPAPPIDPIAITLPMKKPPLLPDDDPSAYTFVFSFRGRQVNDLRWQLSHWKTGHVFMFDSHLFKQIVGSFKQTNGKFHPGTTGAVYIDLDPGNMSQSTLCRYMEVMALTLARLLWAGGQNTKIGVVVLSSGPVFHSVVREGLNLLEIKYQYFVVRAEHLGYEGNIEDKPIAKVFSVLKPK